MPRTRRIPLQLKLTAALLVIVLVPLAVSAYFIGQLGKAAANVAAGEASARVAVLERAIETTQEFVHTTKRLHGEIAVRLAQRPELAAPDADAELAKILDDEPGLRALALIGPGGEPVAAAERPLPGPKWRDKEVDEPIGERGTLRLTFMVPANVNEDLDQLKQAIDATNQFVQIRTALPSSYEAAFLITIGITGVLVVVFGAWASTRVTRRIASLVSTARRVSDGHHEARVALKGKDEMAELGSAFNTMLDDLDETRRHVEYLQRMGVWQEVARKLAHEIKNPLTPIQLAVQQCVSAYKGADTDPARYAKLLRDTGEIVEEEIAGLRRLVDTFRTLGTLPKVEAAPLALADVIEELRLDPTMAARLTLAPPRTPVTVRADKLLLKRVLANLVENAIHAGQDAGGAGDVVIGWSASADAATICVDDHGPGVAEAARAKIFEPYFTTKPAGTGTGLGLAIARKIAIEHGGELSVAPDRAPTGGARFVVSLPLRGPETSLA